MILTIKERIAVPSILQSQTGGLSHMILVNEIIKKTEITADDVLKTGMIDTQNGDTIWDAKKDPNKEFEFNKAELEILKNGADEIEKAKRITMNNFSLIVKILGK